MIAKELREKSSEELVEEVGNIRKEVFNLRYQKETSENTTGIGRINYLKKDVARIKTILKERSN